jgi:hypothetical protein
MVHTQSNDLTTDFIIKEVMHNITAEDNKKNLQYICFNKVLQTKIPQIFTKIVKSA